MTAKPRSMLGSVAIALTLGSMPVAGARDGIPPAAVSEPTEPVTGSSVTATVQQADPGGVDRRRASYRGDLTATLPVPAPLDGRGSLFGHIRFGRGTGLTTGPAFTGSLNSVAFEQADGSSFAILAQLYYQVDIPLQAGNGRSAGRVALTGGKLDPFAFFDQNEVSDDETVGFLNNVFVHNPLLDSGGDIGGDRYGFGPGLRAAWFSGEPHGVGASFGIFGSGRGAEFRSSPARPFLIVQLEVAPGRGDERDEREEHEGRGERRSAGNYRLYAWSNPQAAGIDGSPARHAGWGASIDQRIGRGLAVFGRWGRRTRGHGTFDQALTVGAELPGSGWRRPRDGLGLAAARLSPGKGYRLPGGPDDDQDPLLRAPGAERILEIFYRVALADGVEVSPGFQILNRAAGDPSAPTRRIFGIRVKLSF